MTQAYNLSQLANNLNTAGQLDATDGLVNAVPVANGGTGATTATAARTNLGLVIGTNVPSPTGTGASGTWPITITNGVYTTGDQTIGGTKTFTNGVRFNDGTTQTTAATAYPGAKFQLFTTSGTFTVPAGITSLFVRVWGAGGGGKGGGINQASYLGGYGGFVEAAITGLTPGASITVTVGTGGNGSAAGVTPGAGGTSSFGTYATGTGGSAAGSAGVGSVSGATRITNNPTIGSEYGSTSGSDGQGDTTGGDIWYGGGGGGRGLSAGGGGGANFLFGPLSGGNAGTVYGPGNAGVNGTASTSSTALGSGGAGGAPGGSGSAGTSSSAGGGGGGGGGVMVFW